MYIGTENKKDKHTLFERLTVRLEGHHEEEEGKDNSPMPKTENTVFDYKSFHDNCWWEVADDYGRSLYSELALLINEKEDKHKIKELISNKLSDWSSHNGRRQKRSQSDFSAHGSISRNTSIGLFFSSHGGDKSALGNEKDKEKEKTEKGYERGVVIGSGGSEREKGAGSGEKDENGGYRVKGRGVFLQKIEERDLEGGEGPRDHIPPKGI